MSDLNPSDLAPARAEPILLNGVVIDDDFAEAFDMAATAVIVTADTPEWAMQAAISTTGFATSVIACGCEAGIDRVVAPDDTPDGRPGVRILLFGFNAEICGQQIVTRVGQCVLTCPGTACFAGLDEGEAVKLGSALRYFGDGYQISKVIDGKRYWRIPVMDGEFLVEHETRVVTGAVGGGNLILLARSRAAARLAAETAIAAMKAVPDVIMPFPGGIVRSGSKVGSKYKALMASTNHFFCPTLKGAVEGSHLTPEVASVLEIVIDGLSFAAVQAAMRAGLHAAAGLGSAEGLVRIAAGNYGGQLGRHHFHLKDLV
ncbi:formylmethanofuran--tetrahydromethanopterin N-formyltransferase [Segnochrobactrum spirostomi]|uniref:Formylmethanofuran--tetrahydromethanopterin formyltransferase n=1 Tax=Segnochrobactrum spirostomi TaxID=2608987 RepID=A0A6A7XYK8_9HYPH|nr:formylmethanofuran--tetrahydromethanopterin N-formyltransferase [Segnochrobactrum spirostomi]MQT11513.1 formylmethanofuran--tetrahydromethanopterin N-formyltransferase [Segnochrobactrum spirostomi]